MGINYEVTTGVEWGGALLEKTINNSVLPMLCLFPMNQ